MLLHVYANFSCEKVIGECKKEMQIFLDVMKGLIPLFKEFPGAHKEH
jgi:hypothetical protein